VCHSRDDILRCELVPGKAFECGQAGADGGGVVELESLTNGCGVADFEEGIDELVFTDACGCVERSSGGIDASGRQAADQFEESRSCGGLLQPSNGLCGSAPSGACFIGRGHVQQGFKCRLMSKQADDMGCGLANGWVARQ
jgi:hypothetical protein